MALSNDALRLKTLIIDNLHHVAFLEGSRVHLQFPTFELMPFDYLEYAERELENRSKVSRINCVSHLKRAMECELDTFLHVLNLSSKVRPSNFPTKLDWVGSMGVFNSRSLRKLNIIRNKVEHEYSIPDIDDLEIYFELVNAFIHTLEGYAFILAAHAEMEWFPKEEQLYPSLKPETFRKFIIKYSFQEPLISYRIYVGDNEQELVFQPDKKDDFLFAVRAFFLLCRATALVSDDYVVKELEKTT